MARVLDFNQEEMTKTKLHMTRGSKSSLWHPHTGTGTHSQVADLPAESSLSALFVQFLQNESTVETSDTSLSSSANKNSQQTRQLAKNLFHNTTSNASSLSGTGSTVVNPFVSHCLTADASSTSTSDSASAQATGHSQVHSANSSNAPPLLPQAHKNALLDDCLNDSSTN